jgi:hypothetical protein
MSINSNMANYLNVIKEGNTHEGLGGNNTFYQLGRQGDKDFKKQL